MYRDRPYNGVATGTRIRREVEAPRASIPDRFSNNSNTLYIQREKRSVCVCVRESSLPSVYGKFLVVTGYVGIYIYMCVGVYVWGKERGGRV